jgi:DnaD/phage-associated family protein
MEEDKDISFLMQEAQIILGRPISNGDSSILLTIHDSDGLPVDVIIMILQYAVNVGKASMKYIENMAINWGEKEINTIEKAENEIRVLDAHSKAWKVLMRIIGIADRSPSAKEDEAADRWINLWKIKYELIKEAYNRCVDAKGKYIIGYMDSIIKRWKRDGVSTLEQASAEGLQRYKASQQGGYKPSYNIDAYKKSSIF